MCACHPVMWTTWYVATVKSLFCPCWTASLLMQIRLIYQDWRIANRMAWHVIAMPAIPHPDHMPEFPYHRIPMERYARASFMGKRTLAHHSSYGCPFFCNFCAVVNMVGGRWLAQSAERTANVQRRLVSDYG